jgi:hypothetical protein
MPCGMLNQVCSPNAPNGGCMQPYACNLGHCQ